MKEESVRQLERMEDLYRTEDDCLHRYKNMLRRQVRYVTGVSKKIHATLPLNLHFNWSPN
jgi:RNase P subunit RPR2